MRIRVIHNLLFPPYYRPILGLQTGAICQVVFCNRGVVSGGRLSVVELTLNC